MRQPFDNRLSMGIGEKIFLGGVVVYIYIIIGL